MCVQPCTILLLCVFVVCVIVRLAIYIMHIVVVHVYSGTPLIRTPMGPIAIVLISGVSAFQGVKIYSSNGDTFRSFRAKCPLNRGVRISEVRISGVPLYTMYANIILHVIPPPPSPDWR